MALEKVWLFGSGLRLDAVQGLLIVCLALALGQQEVAGAYSQQELLTWLQQSNFGYQVLQQANSSSDELLCVTEVALLLQAAERHALPAVQVLDAWGKFPHGLLYGHFSDLGNYESCLSQSLSQSLGNSAAALAPSKYCLAHIAFESLLATDEDPVSISIGTCIPAACSADQLNRWLNNYLQRIFEDAAAPQLQLVQESNCALAAREPMASLDWFAIVLLITLALLVVLCTLLDYFK
ncbi:uncharacterized protein LOC108658330, partial [Drosophila navojoa]